MKMRSIRTVLVLTCVVALMAGAAGAQDGEKKKPCTAPEHSQFDFWVGNWTVTDPDGKFQGTNRVEKILDGCVIQENWTGAGGTEGHSFNIYAAARKVWHQTWVDGTGMLLLLDGEFDGERMVLRGETPDRNGDGTIQHEISWQEMETGQVRQTWRMSKDGGASWNDAFVGIYSRQKN